MTKLSFVENQNKSLPINILPSVDGSTWRTGWLLCFFIDVCLSVNTFSTSHNYDSKLAGAFIAFYTLYVGMRESAFTCMCTYVFHCMCACVYMCMFMGMGMCWCMCVICVYVVCVCVCACVVSSVVSLEFKRNYNNQRTVICFMFLVCVQCNWM